MTPSAVTFVQGRTFGTELRMLAAGCALVLILSQGAFAEAPRPAGAKGVAEEEWEIVIRPQQPIDSIAAVSGAPAAQASQPSPDASVSAASGVLVPRMTYKQAFASIPFSREEYEANPGYRHDAAMELMFGTLRPTTVVRQTIPYFSRYPDFFRNRFQIFPYPNQQGGGNTMQMFSNWSMNTFAY
ncbi:MAG TPA: hypothetical protein VL475_04485 [Planctomycetaceae bacterium]|nr:hypothetical protein [Planctomycetaceae bacterium]